MSGQVVHDSQFGELPDSPVITYEIRDVRGEVVLLFPLDRELAESLLDGCTGFSLLGGDSPILASLGIAAFDVLIRGEKPRPVSIAFLWIPVSPPANPLARGDDQVLALETWSGDEAFREVLSEAGVFVKDAKVALEHRDGRWEFRIVDENGSLTGTCTPTSEPRDAAYLLPAFTTAWSGRSRPEAFTIYTYHGHRTQTGGAEVEIGGDSETFNKLATALSGETLSASIQTGWTARAGVYRHESGSK